MTTQQPSLSQLDLERFGVITAKHNSVTAESLDSILQFCHNNAVQLLIARCSTFDLATAQAMEKHGFALMDTLVYYVRKFAKGPIPQADGPVTIRSIQPGEAEAVEAIARESFRGYYGHYHADSRLPREACDEVYVSWAYNSCLSKAFADEVLVADTGEQLAGFATLRLNTPDEGEGVLFGVAPFAQGMGIYRSFMIHGMQWCLAQGAKQMVVSTQITNIAVQKVWVRLGFEPSHSVYTFHKWFD
ncbi:MAG: hypothetical protein Kow0077_16880 [Anaerolineae bacterium]